MHCKALCLKQKNPLKLVLKHKFALIARKYELQEAPGKTGSIYSL